MPRHGPTEWKDDCTVCEKETPFRIAQNGQWFCTVCGTHYDPLQTSVTDERTPAQRKYGLVHTGHARQDPRSARSTESQRHIGLKPVGLAAPPATALGAPPQPPAAQQRGTAFGRWLLRILARFSRWLWHWTWSHKKFSLPICGFLILCVV